MEVLVSVMVLGAVVFLGYMSLFVAGRNSKRAANQNKGQKWKS